MASRTQSPTGRFCFTFAALAEFTGRTEWRAAEGVAIEGSFPEIVRSLAEACEHTGSP